MGVLAKAFASNQPRMSGDSHNFVGAKTFKEWNPGSLFGHYKSDAYASAYPSIRAIANEYMAVMPHAVDRKGQKVKSPVLDALYHPNQSDSSIAFFEKMAVSTLSLPKTYLLVWRRDGLETKPGGDFTTDTIAGFTYLEFPAVTRRDGHTYYNIGAQEFSDKEVLVLPGGVDPHNLYGGYSPSEAARRWSKLDDYIADFQAGFFENNAIPAGTFIITAPSTTEYDNIVDKLQERHRGAGNNNNVSYSHRPIDPMSGKPAQAQVEWVPYSQSNKDIDFKNLFEQTNKRIDMSFGVSQFIKGIDDAPNYATAQVSDKNFAKRAVLPLLLRNYTQLTHELNRITNGLGVAITFKYTIPTVADEVKVEAETTEIQFRTFKSATDAGFAAESVVDALSLPASFKNLKANTSSVASPEEDNPDVDEGNEVKKSPDPSKIDGVTPVSKTKTIAKVKDELTESDADMYEEQLKGVVRDNMSKQIENYISSLDTQDAEGDPTEQDIEEFTDEMMVVIVATITAAGLIQYDNGIELLVAAGINTDSLTSYVVTEAQEKAYRDYLIDIAKSYGDDTGSAIRNVLARGKVEGWDRNTLEANLRNIMNTDDWRVTRLATSEVNRSQDMGSINAMKQIQDEAEVKFERALLHTGSEEPCEYCRAYIDNWMPLDDNMISKEEQITGADGGILVYTWDDNEGHDVHANGHCVPQFRVVKQ